MIKAIGATLVALIAIASGVSVATASDLPRRPMLGAAIAPIPDAVRSAQRVPAGQGVLIANVLPGLSAEAAGLKTGDILIALDGKPVTDAPAVVRAVRAHKIGDTIAADYLRNGAPLKAQLALKGLPYETAEDFDVAYEAVDIGDSTRRVIITKPRDQRRHPAVLLIGGIGCYSFDAGNNKDDAYRQLLSALTRRGFVTLRVEKSGMGDSTGTPCSEVDLQNEVDGYIAGLRLLKGKPYVDANRAFIVGHSIGGIDGPMVAAKERVRGMLVMETVGLTWFEYELINTRRQLKLAGASPEDIGAAMLQKQWCTHRYLIDRQPRAKIIAERPDCDDFIKYPASDAYMQQIGPMNLAGLWTPLQGTDIAVIYGAADFVTGAEESKAIVEAVNAVRPGTATYIEIPDMDHYLVQTPNQAASFARSRTEGPAPVFHPRLAKIVGDWLDSQAG